MSQDDDHLRLLSIFHYIIAALAAIAACFPLIHLILGAMIIVSPDSLAGNGKMPPPFLGWIFVIVASVAILIGWCMAIMILLTGRLLAQRRRHLFCLIIAGIECFFVPIGTVLGIFTIIVLMRESVKQQFGVSNSQAHTATGPTNHTV